MHRFFEATVIFASLSLIAIFCIYAVTLVPGLNPALRFGTGVSRRSFDALFRNAYLHRQCCGMFWRTSDAFLYLRERDHSHHLLGRLFHQYQHGRLQNRGEVDLGRAGSDRPHMQLLFAVTCSQNDS